MLHCEQMVKVGAIAKSQNFSTICSNYDCYFAYLHLDCSYYLAECLRSPILISNRHVSY